jgi:hypothetical protein
MVLLRRSLLRRGGGLHQPSPPLQKGGAFCPSQSPPFRKGRRRNCWSRKCLAPAESGPRFKYVPSPLPHSTLTLFCAPDIHCSMPRSDGIAVQICATCDYRNCIHQDTKDTEGTASIGKWQLCGQNAKPGPMHRSPASSWPTGAFRFYSAKVR